MDERTLKRLITGALAGGAGIVAAVILGGAGSRSAQSGQQPAPVAGSTCGISIPATADDGEVTAMKVIQDLRKPIPAIDGAVPVRTEIALFALG